MSDFLGKLFAVLFVVLPGLALAVGLIAFVIGLAAAMVGWGFELAVSGWQRG